MAPDEIPAPPQSRTAVPPSQPVADSLAMVDHHIIFAGPGTPAEPYPASSAGSLLGDALVLVVGGTALALALLVIVPANAWPLWLALGLPAAGARVVVGLLALPRRQRTRPAASSPVPAHGSVLTDLRVVELGGGEARP